MKKLTLAQFFKELGKCKGKFYLKGAKVRHINTDCCPIEYLTAKKTHKSIESCRGHLLGLLDSKSTGIIINAADASYKYLVSTKAATEARDARESMLEVLGL